MCDKILDRISRKNGIRKKHLCVYVIALHLSVFSSACLRLSGSMTQYVTVQCSAVQYSTVQYSTCLLITACHTVVERNSTA